MATKIEATIADLYRTADRGKAELVHGEIVMMSPTGGLPGYAAGEIFASLRTYARLLHEDVVRVYRANQPETPTIFRRGQMAEAEPAVPDWRMAVNDLFPE